MGNCPREIDRGLPEESLLDPATSQECLMNMAGRISTIRIRRSKGGFHPPQDDPENRNELGQKAAKTAK
jgi:hypothetical protein